MYRRLLDFLRCPDCGNAFDLEALTSSEDGVSEGILYCRAAHFFPVLRGIPRLLPDSIDEHWRDVSASIPSPPPASLANLLVRRAERSFAHDQRTKANFTHEWQYHEAGDRTWAMDLAGRVECFFLDPIRIPRSELKGKLILDAGCGNGSQSVAYTELGCEVVAVDLSSGLERGQKFRRRHKNASPDKVHFVQADLRHPPFARSTFDVIHSAGVLHHTPNTRHTFTQLAPLLKPNGTFYVWLYKHEAYVTPLVNGIRRLTTSIPAARFARIANLMAPLFQGFCFVVDALGIRAYTSLSRREAALALMDIFGAPYAHAHSYDEVAAWFRAEGATELWPCNEGRRGFGICGRLNHVVPSQAV